MNQTGKTDFDHKYLDLVSNVRGQHKRNFRLASLMIGAGPMFPAAKTSKARCSILLSGMIPLTQQARMLLSLAMAPPACRLLEGIGIWGW